MKCKVLIPFAYFGENNPRAYSVDDIADLEPAEAARMAKAGMVELLGKPAPKVETASLPERAEKAVKRGK